MGLTKNLDERTLQIYNDMTMMRMVYAWLLYEKITQFKREFCLACEENQPGQRAHMERGCLTEFGEAIEMYIWKAELAITVGEMSDLYCEILNMLHLKVPSNVYTIAQCAKGYTEMEEDLESYELDGLFYPRIFVNAKMWPENVC